MCSNAVQWHLICNRIGISTDESLSEVSDSMATNAHVECATHLHVVDVHDTIVSFVLVPPIWKAVRILVDVQSIDE